MALVERRIDKQGRIVLPIHFRKALGLEGEADVVLDICGILLLSKVQMLPAGSVALQMRYLST